MVEFLDGLLVTATREIAPVDEEKTKSEEKRKGPTPTPEAGGFVNLLHYGAHPTEHGMPADIRHNPDNIYAKVHVTDVDTRSLRFYNLPYTKAQESPNHYTIWKSMEPWECEESFQHTKSYASMNDTPLLRPKPWSKLCCGNGWLLSERWGRK